MVICSFVRFLRCGRMLASVAVFVAAGCSSVDPAPTVESAGLTPTVAPDAILGFEVTSGWTASAGKGSATTLRTQGAYAYQLAVRDDEFELKSARVGSTAQALAGISDEGSTLSLDVMLPPELKQKKNDWIELAVKIPSQKLGETKLGRVDLAKLRPGVYSTVSFPVGKKARTALAGSYDDLTLTIRMHAEDALDCDDDKRLYRFDHLRAHSPSVPPPGPGQSVDVVALLAYAPPASTPGVASFPVGVVQVPASFHVKLGAAGTGTVTLDLGYEGTPSFSCSYGADASGTSYSWKSCTGPAQPGDLVGADWARLTIVSGDASKGTTKIRAQLALNPVGDSAGANVIPPMPTFWGDTPQSSSQIVTDYFNQVNATSTRSSERFVQAPVGEFARRNGTGAPHDNLTGPPPPNDPPFDQEGHMNPGGNWDAYWRLAGSLSSNNLPDGESQAHFDATLSGHGVVWGNDVEVVSLQASVDTDSGQPDASGFANPTATGSLHMFLFSNELPGGGSASPSTGFQFNINTSQNFDLPPISIWIFSITIGVNASAGVNAQGSLSFDGFDLQVTPDASVGAHLEGDISIGVASGGVSADIALLEVSTPVNASATWSIDTDPGVCNATFNFLLDGKAKLSTLGGEVDLEATFGVCPFCDHESWTIFNWSPIDLGTKQLFHFAQTLPVVSLPTAACIIPLGVTITPPVNPTATVPEVLAGTVVRPSQHGGFGNPVACQYWTWSSTGNDSFSSTVGCNPIVTWGSGGTRTLTLSATDQFGESGSASVQVNVAAPPATPQAYILTPPDNTVAVTTNAPYTVNLSGGASGGAPPYTLSWVYQIDNGPYTSIGSPTTGTTSSTSFIIPASSSGTYIFTLLVADQNNLVSSANTHVLAETTQ